MQRKKYSSYEEIDQDLEILNLERELNYQKMLQSLEQTKESLSPSNLIGNVPKLALDLLTSSPVRNIGISYLFKKIFRRK